MNAQPQFGPLVLQARESLSPVLRRVPEQKRSWARVESVLRAADEIVSSDGIPALTQNPTGLAARAGLPNGTFYNYFLTADDVVEALRRVWVGHIYAVADAGFATPPDSWQVVADRLVDTAVDFFSTPSTRVLWMEHQLSVGAREHEIQANRHLGRLARIAVESIGIVFIGDEDDELVLVEIADQLTRLAYTTRQLSEPDPVLLQRAKRATRAYLSTLVSLSR